MKPKKIILILILFIINFTVSIFCLMQLGFEHDVLATTEKMYNMLLKKKKNYMTL